MPHRLSGVQLGEKCTVMMYGPTGSGKCRTMFGCSTQQGIVYRSLKDIFGGESLEIVGLGTFVQVSVLEIYNEEIYDLLSTGNAGGGFILGWPRNGSASKVKLQVMGKKAKNAAFISRNEAAKMLVVLILSLFRPILPCRLHLGFWHQVHRHIHTCGEFRGPTAGERCLHCGGPRFFNVRSFPADGWAL